MVLIVTPSAANNVKTPILIIASDSDFGTYTGEILKTEGLNEYQIESLNGGNITASYLEQFELIILAECILDSNSKNILQKYVRKGGNLIAFRPDKAISEVFGITPLEGSISDGYIGIDTKTDEGRGLTSETMQFHGAADKYSLSGARIIASLFSNATAEEKFPGVVRNTYGKGHAIAFLYNLPKSIVYTRQGNPLFAGIEKDGILGLRAMDLFADGWVDNSKNTINQADQQMALLTHSILSLSTKPLPRFWYFPEDLNCLVVLDNDGEDSSEADFDPQFRDVDAMDAKMTLYIKDVEKVSTGWVEKWVGKGFEIAAHPDDTQEAEHPTWKRMDSVLGDIKNQIDQKYGLTIRTNVNHWFVWPGNDADGTKNFAAQAELEAKHGIEMDGNYAHYDINSNQGVHYLGPLGINHGNYNGSGLVMKFAHPEGKTINVYQRFNAVYDQQYMESEAADEFFYSFKGLMDRSLNKGIYSIISIKAHNNEYHFSKEPLMKMLSYAKQNGVPVWTAEHLLDFLKMKDEATFTEMNWADKTLTFKLVSPLQNASGLTFLIPAKHVNTALNSIKVNEQDKPISLQKIKGYEYSLITVEPGATYEISASYK
jgi:hypothetical protein